MTTFIVMIVIVVLLFNVETVNYLVVLIFYTHINVIFVDYINVKVVFIQKEEIRKHEVEEWRKELEELKKSLGVRLKNKNEMINRRLQELLNEDKYLDWD